MYTTTIETHIETELSQAHIGTLNQYRPGLHSSPSTDTKTVQSMNQRDLTLIIAIQQQTTLTQRQRFFT